MAAVPDAVKDLEDQLTCPVCLSLYQNPKVLACHHVFCAICLVKCVIQDEQRQSVVVCPSCREYTPRPAGGVASLPAAFQTNKLFDVHAKLVTTGAVPVPSEEVPTPKTKDCSVHPGKVLELWCERCEELICFHCGLEGERHHNHKYSLVTKMHQQSKEDISAALAPLREQKSAVKYALNSFDEHVEKLYKEKDAAEQAIRDTTEELLERITKEEADCIGKLYGMVEGRVDEFAPHRAQLETSLAQLEDCIKSVEGKLDGNKPEELVSQRKSLCLKAARVTQDFQPEALMKSYEGNVKFKCDMDLFSEALQNCFLVFCSDVCPRKCRVSGEGLEKALVGKESVVCLDLFTTEGQSCKLPVQDIRCQLVSDITGKNVNVTMNRFVSKSVFSYCPTVKGRHVLSIKVEGEHVLGSPFSIAVQSSNNDYSSPLNIIATSTKPLSVVVLESGRVVITSLGSKSIEIYDQRGQLTCRHANLCYTRLTLKSSTCVLAVDRERAVFEVNLDSVSTSIFKFSAPQFAYISDVAVDNRNNTIFLLYYTLIGSIKPRYVEVHNSSQPKYNAKFGEHGSGKGQLVAPMGIALEPNLGRVYVADTGNHRIQVFDTKGKFLSRFGKEGTSPGCLSHPTAVVLHDELVFVGDEVNCVSVFSVNGRFLFNVGATLNVETIEDMTVDDSGVLYVCDTNNSRVLLF